jgi:formylglycine-generating enzyme required for sulfatase activity
MAYLDELQAEISKLTGAIKSLEELRGKIPAADLDKSLSAYRNKLHSVLEQYRAEKGKSEGNGESRTPYVTLTPNAVKEAYAAYLSAPGEPGLTEDEFKIYLGQYLTWVDTTYNSIGLFGLDNFHSEGGKLTRPLRDMFLPPVLAAFNPNKLSSADILVEEAALIKGDYDILEERQAKGELVPLADLLTGNKHMAVMGVAGCGKSTLLAYLATCLATNAQKGKLLPFNLPKKRETLIPILIPVSSFMPSFEQMQQLLEKKKQEAKSKPAPPGSKAPPEKADAHPLAAKKQVNEASSEQNNKEQGQKNPEESDLLAGFLQKLILQYLQNCLPAMPKAIDFFERLLQGGGCLLMLDGLDEVNKPDKRILMRQQLNDLVKKIFPESLVLVTAREVGMAISGMSEGNASDAVIGEGFTFLHLRRLASHSKSIEQLVLIWVRQFNPRKTDALNHDIMAVIGDLNQRSALPGLQPFISTPMMVNLLISARLGITEWPPVDVKLVDILLKVILKYQTRTDDPLRREKVDWGGTVEEQIEWLTKLAYEMHKMGPEGTAIPETKVRYFLKDTLPEEKLDMFLNAVRMRGVLLEERAGSYRFNHLLFQKFLAVRMIVTNLETKLDELEFNLSKSWWRSALMMVNRFAEIFKPAFAQPYTEWLMKFQLVGLDLAGAALLETQEPKADERHKIARELAALLGDKKITATNLQRASAGNTLGRLGDPRFHTIDAWFLPVDELFGFVPVPEGNYVIGSNPERDSDATVKEVPLHELKLYSYYISRYPVTVAQYRAFITETGYKLADPRSLESLANHPVAWISWDDAMLYCQWLEHKLTNSISSPPELAEKLKTGDWKLTIPSEAEWEAAARGNRGRLYPWGSPFDLKKANTSESNIGTTTAVGCFPTGESQIGLQDLCGNVWEWTRSVYRIYYYTSNDGREDLNSRDFHVLRGGAFNSTHKSSRCAFRNMYYPDYKDEATGFRTMIYQTHEWIEEEVDVEVPLEAGETSPDGKSFKMEKRIVRNRRLLVVEGPKQDK